jgi:hypothetical protein
MAAWTLIGAAFESSRPPRLTAGAARLVVV